MKVRPVSVALVTDEDNDTVHFEQSHATADQTDDQGDAARAFLGPEIAELAAPQASTAYPVMGVAPGMTVEEAVDALSQSFSEAEITVADSILRAERGYCGYDGAGGGTDEDELGAICFVAGLKDERVSGRASSDRRARADAGLDRGDARASALRTVAATVMFPPDTLAGAKSLRRHARCWDGPTFRIPAHEAEVDHIVVNPKVAIFTLRADAPAASDARNAVGGEPSPETQTAKSSSRAPRPATTGLLRRVRHRRTEKRRPRNSPSSASLPA